MIVIATRTDGGVTVITLVPVSAVTPFGTMTILGVRRNDPKDGTPGGCIIYGVRQDGSAAQIRVGDESYDIRDLQADSAPGVTFIFPDVDQHVLAKWLPEARITIASHRPGQLAELPSSRLYRNAWVDSGTVQVDMPKARDIQRQMMRVARDPLLADLDTQYLRADEAKDQKAKDDIAVQKQILRDVTADPAIEAATTPEELKAVWPEALTAKP